MRESFIKVAHESPFPIQNLPFGVFSTDTKERHVGVAIGDQVLDLTQLEMRGVLKGEYFQAGSLNRFIEAGSAEWRRIRASVGELLDANNSALRDNTNLRQECLNSLTGVTMHMPVEIGDYTDFYSSREHATNIGSMFRDPKNALLPNWLHVPIAYHGRASSVVISGTPVRRPCGQTKPEGQELPGFGPSKALDFELEIGFIVGKSNSLGEPIPIDQAADHIFGVVLVNDWSARDMQVWEYVPLGPFLAKNFATSISPWVVTLDALEPFRVPGPEQVPEPLPYLKSEQPWNFDITLEVWLKSASMSHSDLICKGNSKGLYWSVAQQLAHHTSNGCPVRVGDLMASGTISGEQRNQRGSMIEITWRGKEPIVLSSGETRNWLQDGDTVTMKAYARAADGSTIGFGEVTATVLPAKVKPELVVTR
jgi:fumarylacetoacetase